MHALEHISQVQRIFQCIHPVCTIYFLYDVYFAPVFRLQTSVNDVPLLLSFVFVSLLKSAHSISARYSRFDGGKKGRDHFFSPRVYHASWHFNLWLIDGSTIPDAEMKVNSCNFKSYTYFGWTFKIIKMILNKNIYTLLPSPYSQQNVDIIYLLLYYWDDRILFYM